MEDPKLPYLPGDILTHVFPHLYGKSLWDMRLVCREWRDISLHTTDWREQYALLWNVPTGERLALVGQIFAQRRVSYSNACSREFWRLCWDSKYKEMMGLYYRPTKCTLYGHKLGVKVLHMVPSSNKILTGSVDRRLICWDGSHFSFSGISQPFAGTIRSIAMDDSILVVGSSDHRIRVWSNNVSDVDTIGTTRNCVVRDNWDSFNHDLLYDDHVAEPGSFSTFPFDIGRDRTVLRGHSGPVSCLALAGNTLISGSWDYSIRVWDTSDADNIECVQLLPCRDWVVDMKRSGNQLFVASGNHILDLRMRESSLVQVDTIRHPNANDYPCTCVANANATVYYAADGHVYGQDLRCKIRASGQVMRPFDCASVLKKDGVTITGMAYEYPWLACSSSSGEVILLNTEDCSTRPHSRVLSPGGKSMIAHCVDICESRVAAGFEDGTVTCWDFSKSQQAASERASLRHRKKAQRAQRKWRENHS